MKIIAYLLVILSALFVGAELNKLQKERLCLTADLVRMTGYMHTELSARPCSMNELCRKAAIISNGGISSFFDSVSEEMTKLYEKSFREIWSDCCADKLKLLDGDTFAMFLGLGEKLGNFELNSQLLAINECSIALKQKHQELKEKYANDRKLNIVVPCSVACMILIMI